jgi:hypothetical protein
MMREPRALKKDSSALFTGVLRGMRTAMRVSLLSGAALTLPQNFVKLDGKILGKPLDRFSANRRKPWPESPIPNWNA